LARIASTEPTRSRGNDVHAGRRLALAMEALGEALVGCDALPAALSKQADALAHGRSTVPADGERSDFPARVARRVDAPEPGAPTAVDDARALEAWLGEALTAWLAEAIGRLPLSPHGFALRDAAELACEAREALVARKSSLAAVYARWHGEGLDDRAKRVFACASTLALEEAVDRWCALGCEGSLDRYVSTWQRSGSGWADAALGTAVDVSVSDLGQLRALQSAVRELRDARPPPRSFPRAIAAKLGVDVTEVERLLALEATVRDRLDPDRSLKRRWALVKPIATAVAALERESGRLPSVSEIAGRAGVHEALVELVMESLGDD
jgi:hypothetical protein